MYRFLDRLTPDHIQAIASLVYVEMLEAGYASVGEFHYLHHAPGGTAYDNPAELSVRIAAAAAETGIGLTHLPVLYMQADRTVAIWRVGNCGSATRWTGSRRCWTRRKPRCAPLPPMLRLAWPRIPCAPSRSRH